MAPSPSAGSSAMRKRSGGVSGGTRMERLDHDILCIIFSFLNVFDLARCTAVCKSWAFETPIYSYIFDFCYKRCWKPRPQTFLTLFFVRVDQCRMKMGLLLTGVGDKVMRLWSLSSYNCEGEYYIPDSAPVVDFDFDKTKIVGLLAFFNRYTDPEAVIGCEDGTVRAFDMYSRTCSRIIKMHAGPVTCLSLSDDHLILSGSSLGSVSISSLSSYQRVATLRHKDPVLKWENWSQPQVFEAANKSFPHLQELVTWNCPKLVEALPNSLTSLVKLSICECPQLAASFLSLPSLCELNLEQCNEQFLARFINLTALARLKIENISNLSYLPKDFTCLVSLERLEVEDCGQLTSLLQEGARLENLSCLKRLAIMKCPQLSWLIDDEDQLPSSLEYLEIEDCTELEKFPNGLKKL
ncbi:hypothetical protein SCA6_015481 [Theobroma cacao]